MSSSVIAKPWGYEYCAFDNGRAAVWILHIARGRQTSRHCHPNKKTRLIPLQGEVRFNGAPLRPLQVASIEKGEFHQTAVVAECLPASENGAFIMEIEEPSDKADILREDDAYGRAGKPIESEEIPYAGELLKLSSKEARLMGHRFKLESTLGGDQPDLSVSLGGEVLGIYREKTVRVADYVADFLAKAGVRHVFGVTGGGSMHLNDALGFHPSLKFVPMHHEQAASFAADAYARLTGIGCCHVTTGPGGTNAVTGCAASYVDSIPVLYLSGQVTTDTLMEPALERSRGIQEIDILSIVKPITKDAIIVKSPQAIRYSLEYALWLAKDGQPGPVWLDIPLDVQSAQVDPQKLSGFERPEIFTLGFGTGPMMEALGKASRPVLVIGNGVHLSGAEDEAREFARRLKIPVISSWTAGDILPDSECHIGHCGIFGDRASNLTIQNADFILAVGSRLSIPQTGHNLAHFARGAKIFMVTENSGDAHRFDDRVTHARGDAKLFLKGALKFATPHRSESWLACCQGWRQRYGMDAETRPEGQNSFKFIAELSQTLPDDAIVVTDMGTSFTCTFQTAKMRRGQRWLTASGHAPMGYGLPGAIGSHYATGKKVVCITGDGGLQFNVQEMMSLRGIPVQVIVMDNGGYLTMKHTQANHFGRFVGSEFLFPSPESLARAYGLPEEQVVSFRMDPMQPLTPRVASYKRPDGTITARPLEDMFPFLPWEEISSQMMVPTVPRVA